MTALRNWFRKLTSRRNPIRNPKRDRSALNLEYLDSRVLMSATGYWNTTSGELRIEGDNFSDQVSIREVDTGVFGNSYLFLTGVSQVSINNGTPAPLAALPTSGVTALTVRLNGHDDTFSLNLNPTSYASWAGGMLPNPLYSRLQSISVSGGFGRDTIDLRGSNATSVTVDGGTENDTIYGGNGNDVLRGDTGADYIDGSNGNDTLLGGEENDTLRGSTGQDNVFGQGGDDLLAGGTEADSLMGGTGKDSMYGEAGNDMMWGEDGNDLLNGGTGADSMYGGNHDDLFICVDGQTSDFVNGDNGRDVAWLDMNATWSGYQWDTCYVEKGQNIQWFTNSADRTLDGDRIADPALKGPTSDTPSPRANAYATFSSNPLFSIAGPTKTDIKQGGLGDCWMLATLAAIATDNRQSITDNVVDFGDGTYGVRLGNSFYRVDNDLPVAFVAFSGGNAPAYAGLGRDNSMWVAVVEKAYAHHRTANGVSNNYRALDGGWGSEAATVFGSTSAAFKNFSDYGSAAAMASDIAARWARGESVTVGWVDGRFGDTIGFTNLVNRHAYSVDSINYNPSTGAITSIVLRNPWGYDSNAGTLDGFNDGVLTVTPAQLFTINGRVDWGKV